MRIFSINFNYLYMQVDKKWSAVFFGNSCEKLPRNASRLKAQFFIPPRRRFASLSHR